MSVSTAYVLSTRPLAGSLIDEAAAQGVVIDVLPFIGTKPLEDEALNGKLEALGRRSLTAVFTSANAVMAMVGNGSSDWKIFCIDGATRRAAAARFGETAIVGVADSAKELSKVIIGWEPPRELWFFCGDRRREELPINLRTAGWVVQEVVVYETVLTPCKVSKSYDAIAFFSPSAVESFFSMNTINPDVSLFAIGRTTAAAIYEKCKNPVTVSKQPDEKTLIEQIIHNNQHRSI
jgi:uroporphyrinogen-III synthase